MRKNLFLALVFSSLVFTACAKNSGENYTTYYPECRQPILEMESQGTRTEGAVKGGLGGGLLGGVTGFLTGLLFNGGNVADAGIGAAIGATAGALTGGISGAMHGTPDNARENQLLAQYYPQIHGDISGMDVRQAAGAVALQCYQKRLASLEAMQRKGEIASAAADQRLLEISQGMEQARQLLGNRASQLTPPNYSTDQN